jgi:hypothetical protein
VTRHSAVGSGLALAAVFGSLLAAACGKADQNKGPGSAAGGAPAAATTQAAAPLPGALAKPLDQYSGDEFFALTRQLQYAGGNERQRRCRGRAACRGAQPATFTSVRLDAIAGEDSLTAAALPANGVIAARAINRGQVADTMYNMQPGAAYENYLIVVPAPGGATANWRLEELTTTAGARAHRTIATGVFHGCQHTFARGARADFKTCAQAAGVQPASFGSTTQGDIEPPIWIGCAEGCCTSDPPGGRG